MTTNRSVIARLRKRTVLPTVDTPKSRKIQGHDLYNAQSSAARSPTGSRWMSPKSMHSRQSSQLSDRENAPLSDRENAPRNLIDGDPSGVSKGGVTSGVWGYVVFPDFGRSRREPAGERRQRMPRHGRRRPFSEDLSFRDR